MKDHAPALGRVQLAQHDGLQFLPAGRPVHNIHIAAETDRWPYLRELDDIQPSLGFQRIVGIQADIDKVLKDALDIAAAVIDDRQTVVMADRRSWP